MGFKRKNDVEHKTTSEEEPVQMTKKFSMRAYQANQILSIARHICQESGNTVADKILVERSAGSDVALIATDGQVLVYRVLPGKQGEQENAEHAFVDALYELAGEDGIWIKAGPMMRVRPFKIGRSGEENLAVEIDKDRIVFHQNGTGLIVILEPKTVPFNYRGVIPYHTTKTVAEGIGINLTKMSQVHNALGDMNIVFRFGAHPDGTPNHVSPTMLIAQGEHAGTFALIMPLRLVNQNPIESVRPVVEVTGGR